MAKKILLKNLLKPDGKADISKIIDPKTGQLIEEALDVLAVGKPIIPIVPEGRRKHLSIKENRDRYTNFPNRLPTGGMMPLPPDEHELIGLYESKQNLYLIIAHAYNKIMERLDQIEEQLKQ